MKLCSKCNLEKQEEHFYYRPDRTKREAQCKECRNAKIAQWAKNNRKKRNEDVKKYRERYPERVKESGKKIEKN